MNDEIRSYLEQIDKNTRLRVIQYIRNLEMDRDELKKYESGEKAKRRTIFWCFSGLAILLALIVGGMYGFPKYSVWQKGLAGQANLRRAEQEKLIMVEQAKAELEASKIRSEAIEIMGALAKQYPEYREQEFIGAFAEAVQDGSIHQIIYVPTESNIPIVEAGRALGK